MFLFSFLLLFAELALIKWTGSNVVYLSYFSNFVLLGSFLGIGIGFLMSERFRPLFGLAPVVLALLVAFVRLFPAEVNRTGGELIYFGRYEPTGLPVWVMLPIVFVAAAAVMALIADGLARVFGQFPPLTAYRLDVMGSIGGIVAFSAVTFLHAPPFVWGMVVAILVVVLLERVRWWHLAALVALPVMLFVESIEPGASWSPYYKVTVHEIPEVPYYDVHVNGIPHQAIQSFERRREGEPIYFKPYERFHAPEDLDVLIIGAGGGTDVAIALSQGASHVDAVEIDPRLLELGRELSPDRPYEDQRVNAIVDDGRAFLERTDKDYDLILFSLPDSLTLISGQSSLRLESYLMTIEAMEAARDHLAPGGAFGMYNYYREDWLVDRLANMLAETFGNSPCLDAVGDFGRLALLMASEDPNAITCDTPWSPKTDIVEAAHDDRPFVYLQHRTIPRQYLLAVGLIALLSLLLVRVAAGPFARMLPYADLFLMGAAFLLLETKSVIQFALLFGTTWFVNAIVFAGILVAVLIGIELAERIQIRRPALVYLLLAAALAVSALVPPAALLTLPYWVRIIAAVAVTFTPVLIANFVFAQRFKSVAASRVAFGTNLLGAMVGGLLEYSSLMIGYRALMIGAALLYGGAFLLGRDQLVTRPAEG